MGEQGDFGERDFIASLLATISFFVASGKTDLLEKQTQNDATTISTLSLEDRIIFSTVTLYLYQRESIKHELIVNEKSVNAYRPHIGLQIVDSLKTGWYMLEGIIAFVTQLWALILIGVLLFVGYRKFVKQ